jgi:hypothetical protein
LNFSFQTGVLYTISGQMNIPPYFPEPIEVPGNIARAKYSELTRFIKWVNLFSFLSLILCYYSGKLCSNWFDLRQATTLCALSLILLSSSRLILNGYMENAISATLLIFTIPSCGMVFYKLNQMGYPVWIIEIAATSAFIYSAFSFHDFSFPGQFIISILICLIVLSVALWQREIDINSFQQAVLIAFAYLFYYIYDFSCLLRRRTKTETLAATADLYRDLLNIFTYSIRVIQHWRKFKL